VLRAQTTGPGLSLDEGVWVRWAGGTMEERIENWTKFLAQLGVTLKRKDSITEDSRED